MACGGLALTGAGTILSACSPHLIQAGDEDGAPAAPRALSYYLPTDEGLWTPPVAHRGDLPAGTGTVEIERVGRISFEAEQVTTVRPDIFQPGHFSLFDVLVHASQKGDIALDYHFDETMDTHVIDALDGQGGWWHNAHYSAGWFEPNVFRMDMYPYKNNMRIRLDRENEGRLEAIHRSFREEVSRLKANGGQVVIPDVRIRAPGGRVAFRDVRVTPHNVRADVLQPGVVTALDALISLAEQGELPELKLTWYERIAGAEPVDSYWVEKLGDDVAVGGCGFVYEAGPNSFAGFSGTHIHIPADVRVTVSPEYALWFWICLGSGRL
jgi:hypothetical protein